MEWTQVFIPIAISFALTVMTMPLFIGYFHMKKRGQVTREEGPTWHQVKTGTPTMGGLVFLLASVVATVLIAMWVKKLTASLWMLLFILIFYGALGFVDDFIKVFQKRNLGLNSKQKLVGQLLGGCFFYLIYRLQGLPDALNLFGITTVSLGLLYGGFVLFWLIGFSNAVNLTDGIDGLVSGLGMISFTAYTWIAWQQRQYDVAIFCLSMIGGLMGFFPYNKKKAQIFMGDVGSLAIGGSLAAVSILLHQEWTLLLIGLIYVCETASVMLQVTSFKLFKKRIFKMSPIHHHFEMSGWSEWKIDIVFWSIAALCALVTIQLLF